MVSVDRSVTTRRVGVEPRSLIAPVEFVKPDIFEKIVLHTGDSSRLIQAAEYRIGTGSGGEIEQVIQCIGSAIIKREEGIIGNDGR